MVQKLQKNRFLFQELVKREFKKKYKGTVLGMLILAVMNNLLNLLGVPPFLREAFKGVIVIAAVMLQKKDNNG